MTTIPTVYWPLSKNEIVAYFHCGDCLAEKPDNESPQDWQRIGVGWTKKGLQVWCTRHDKNVIHLDFCGQKVQVATADGETARRREVRQKLSMRPKKIKRQKQ